MTAVETLPRTAVLDVVDVPAAPLDATTGPVTVTGPVAGDIVDGELFDPLTDDSPITVRRYVAAAGWGAAAAAATVYPAVTYAPEALSSVLVFTGFVLGFLGFLDQRTRLIRNEHTVAAAIGVTALLGAAQFLTGVNYLLPAFIGAVVMFAVMIVLVFTTGFAGGGDIKLAPVIAAPLAAMSAVTPSLWLAAAFIICLVVMVIKRVAGSADKYVPMVPMMAVGYPLAIVATNWLYTAAGMPAGF